MSCKCNQTASILYNEAHRLSFWQTTVCTLTVLCGSLGCLTVCGVFALRTGSLLSLCIWQEQTSIQSVILSLLSSLQARQMYTRIHIFPPAAVTQQKTHQFNFFLGGGGSRDHDLDGRHNPDEKGSEIKREYSWQRKFKVPAEG